MVTNMSVRERLVNLFDHAINRFIDLVLSANTDIPLHDFAKYAAGTEPTTYNVGTNNMHGDQKKKFISKITLVYCAGAATIRLNNSGNVTIDILAGVWFTFRQNIHTVFIDTITAQSTLYFYFEGTLPEEGRIGT